MPVYTGLYRYATVGLTKYDSTILILRHVK